MPPPNFNHIARLYRWLEYLTLGPALERCRLHFLPRLLQARRALVLGDGDGRFLAHLLAHNPHIRADAVDLSPVMLHLLRQQSNAPARLQIHLANALNFQPSGPYDLVITHFFLDCLSTPELNLLASRLAPHLAPGALWLFSDFRIPSGPLRLPAKLLIRLLYLAFRLLTGLRVTRLPDHEPALHRIGLTRIALQRFLGQILTTELWQAPPIATLPSSNR